MSSNEIVKKSDYQHIRLRTHMYLGSPDPHTQTVLLLDDDLKPYVEEVTWVPALFTSFREILDNALDEVVGHGHGNRIDVTYDENEIIFSVKDNGRGIPLDWDEEHGMHKVTMALTEPRAGRNFGERLEVVGTNGIGASASNITSEWFDIDVVRDGKRFQQRCQEGNEVVGDFLQIGTPKITDNKGSSYTSITFKPSREVFKHRILPDRFVFSRLAEIAIANPLIKIHYNGKQIKAKPRPEQNLFTKDQKPVFIEIQEDGFRSKFWLLGRFLEEGDHTHTMVNNIFAVNGGVHVEMFKRHFFGNLITALEKESRKRKLTPNRSDVTETVLIYNITNMRSPNFDSQSKTRLTNEEVAKIISKALTDPEFYKDVIKRNKEWIDEIYQRCAERTHQKEAIEISRAAKKLTRLKVPDLMDATGKDRSKCICVFAEGNSAISGIASVRDPELHGGLGLRGKILNVNGESPKKILDSEALANIMNSIGLVIGEKADRSKLRYGKIYLAMDEDEDGKNIAALMVNFFYTFWPELFDPKQEPFVHKFQTPFIIAEKGKTRKYWYAHDYHEFDPSQYSGWSITRAKGLGSLTEEDWRHALANPVSIPIVDDGKLKEALDLIFNQHRADDRKDWIGL